MSSLLLRERSYSQYTKNYYKNSFFCRHLHPKLDQIKLLLSIESSANKRELNVMGGKKVMRETFLQTSVREFVEESGESLRSEDVLGQIEHDMSGNNNIN